MYIRIVILLAAAIQCACKERRRPGLRVVNGEPDTDRRYPYVVALVQRDNNEIPEKLKQYLTPGYMERYCTGSVIAPEWVITAAHCISNGRPDPNQQHRVVFGDLTNPLNETRYYRKIKEFIKHPQLWTWFHQDLVGKMKNNIKYDIGLVLIDSLQLKRYGKVSAVDYKSLLGRPVVYAGAGSTLPNKQYTYEEKFNKILFLKHKIEDDKKPLQIGHGVVTRCSRDPRKVVNCEPAICVASKCSKSDHGTLPGDSGGPLFYKGKIVAVLTGAESDRVMAPAIYTALSSSLGWISRVVSTRNCSKF